MGPVKTWKATCSDPDFDATIEHFNHEETRPFFWAISAKGMGMLYHSTQPAGYAKTLSAAKSMCAREIRWNRKGAQLTWAEVVEPPPPL